MRSFLRKFVAYFVAAGIFSFFLNLFLLTPSLYMLQVYDRVLGSRNVDTLYFLTSLLVAALLVMGGMEFVRARLLVRANNAIDAELAPYLFRKMTEGAVAPEGNKYAHGLKDLSTIKSFLTGSGALTLFDAPWTPIAMCILWYMHTLLFVTALIGAVLMIVLTIANELATRHTLEQANKMHRSAGRHVEVALRNAEVINGMGMLASVTKRWGALNDAVIALQTKASNRAGVISSITKVVRQVVQSVCLGVGAYIVIQEPSFSPGMMIAGMIVLGKALGPIEHLIAGWKGFLEARIAYARLDAFLSIQQHERVPMELPAPTGTLSVQKVVFGIRSTNKIIIKDVSFHLEPGDCLGVIGPSAAGKSSLARLLVGVWQPLSGSIRLDSAEIGSWPSDRLGEYLGYLPQDIELFGGTIAENIARLAEPDADKVIKAAQQAGLHELILHMPNGYDTYIGEGGAVLSGGQRQRIGLARALYGNPRIVVLDEPDANLDTNGERALQQALVALKASGTTVIIVTHKLPLLSMTDKILAMQDGAVVAFGPRDQVLQQIQKALQVPKPTQPGPVQQGVIIEETAGEN